MPLEYCELTAQDFLGRLLPDLGIDTKTALHPQQIPDVEEAFRRDSPTSYVQRTCDIINNWFVAGQSPYAAKNTEGDATPSLCVYGQNDAVRQAYLTGLTFRKGDRSIAESMAGVAWAWVVMIIDVNVWSTDVALRRAAKNRTSDRMYRILERQEGYVRKIMQYQHRRHVLTLFIQDREMRFAFWDRAGVLLSEPVDYLDNPDSLFKFLSAFINANSASQGYDETATLASPEQVRALERYTPNECYSDSARERLCLAKEAILGETKTHRNLSPIYCVKCEDTTYRTSNIPQELRTFTYLIARPDCSSRCLLGRGSRGLVAFDVDHNELVYMRDSWIPEDSIDTHGLEVSEVLAKAGVRYVPTTIAGGFVGAQATITQAVYLQMGKDPSRWRKRRHHRLIVAQIWRSLWEFKDSRQLVSAINDALIAHQDAYELAGLLHQDVTADSILIDSITGRGFLDDWCMSASRDDLASSARVGTWTYMSGLLQTYPRKPNMLSDDLESFVWSLVLPVLRFIVNDQSMVFLEDGTPFIDLKQYNTALDNFVERTFHSKFRDGDYICGGHFKIEQIMRYEDLTVKLYNQSSPLAKLLDDLFALLHEFYISLDDTALKVQWSVLGASPRARPRVSWKKGFKGPGARSACLDTHERIRAVFSAVLDDPTLNWTDERTVDQFLGFTSSVPYYSFATEGPLQYGNAEQYLSSESDSDGDLDVGPEPKRARFGA